LADGIGPSLALSQAGVALCLGSDSHAVIDLLEEARALEMNQRLATLRRGCHQAEDLLTMATANGYRSLGWNGGGCLKVGEVADFAAIRLDSVRTVGTPPGPAVVFSATAADITDLVVAGRRVVTDSHHRSVDAVAALWQAHNELYL
jgi:cytosine/adenosine deaminase-related metal-dependent hydrolase